MSKGKWGNRFSEEVGSRAVRLVLENEANYQTGSECLRSISSKICCSAETLREWIKRDSIEQGTR